MLASLTLLIYATMETLRKSVLRGKWGFYLVKYLSAVVNEDIPNSHTALQEVTQK